MNLNTVGEIDREYFNDIVLLIQNQALSVTYQRLYAQGKNYYILNQPAKKSPDNRVPVPFAKLAIEMHVGYAAKPGSIKYKALNGYADMLKKDIFDINDEELLTSEIYHDSLAYGKSYEILRYSLDEKIKQYRIEPDAGTMVYDNTLDRNPIAFAHYRTLNDIDYLTLYYANFFIEYQKKTVEKDYVEVERRAHPFGGVPAIEYTVNPWGLSLIDTAKAIIDENDKIMSSSYADERERFSQAYLLLMRHISRVVGTDGLSDAEKLNQIRLLDGLGDDEKITSAADGAAFLVKPSRGADVAEAADRHERLVYKAFRVIDVDDESFGNDASGVARAYKLLPMEWASAFQLAYFQKGLQRRLVLIGNALKLLKNINNEQVTIQFNRNLPMDLQNLAMVSSSLKGILPDDIILSLWPADIVPDVQAVIDKMGDTLPRLEA